MIIRATYTRKNGNIHLHAICYRVCYRVKASGRVATWYQAFRYTTIGISSQGCMLHLSSYFSSLHTSTLQILLDKPWSQVSSFLPPGSCLQFLLAPRVQQSHCSSIFHGVLLIYNPRGARGTQKNNNLTHTFFSRSQTGGVLL